MLTPNASRSAKIVARPPTIMPSAAITLVILFLPVYFLAPKKWGGFTSFLGSDDLVRAAFAHLHEDGGTLEVLVVLVVAGEHRHEVGVLEVADTGDNSTVRGLYLDEAGHAGSFTGSGQRRNASQWGQIRTGSSC